MYSGRTAPFSHEPVTGITDPYRLSFPNGDVHSRALLLCKYTERDVQFSSRETVLGVLTSCVA